MAAAEPMDRAHALLQVGGRVWSARQTGLYQLEASAKAVNLFARWRSHEATPALAIAHDSAANITVAGINGGVARSTDGGRNWAAIAFRAPPPLVTCLAPTNDFTAIGWLLAGTYEDGVFRSDDGGLTWRANNHGLFDHSLNCLALAPNSATDCIVYAGTASGLYRSQ